MGRQFEPDRGHGTLQACRFVTYTDVMSIQANRGMYPLPHITFGDRVRRLRITLDMNQRDFGESIAFSGAAVAKWERMDHEPRSVQRIINAVQLRYGVEIAEFLRGPQPTDYGSRPRHLVLVRGLNGLARTG